MILMKKDVYLRLCDLETMVDFLQQHVDLLEDKIKKLEKLEKPKKVRKDKNETTK